MNAPPAIRAWHLVLVFAFCAFAGSYHHAQAGDSDFGSTVIVGLGGAYIGALEDAGSIWFNPAATDTGTSGSASLGYRRLWGIPELAEVSVAVRQNLGRSIRVGAGFDRFGEAGLYQEYDAIGSAAYRLSPRWSAGIALHYLRREFGDNEVAASGAFVDAGVIATPALGITGGAAVRRISLDGMYGDDADEPGPVYEISAAWSAQSELALAAVWTRESNGDNRFGIGQRMEVGQAAEFLAGLRFDPVRYTLGGEIHHGVGALQYVYQSHSDLGGTHIIGLAWGW